MKKYLIILAISFTLLACSLTAPRTYGKPVGEESPTNSQPAPTAGIVTTNTSQPDQSTPLPTCKISTGLEAGTVNLRTCASMDCQIIRVLGEGEALEVIASGEWLQVKTGEGLTGYVNSKFCK